MNSVCGELGLRIALCDLIERLKRCEQKCSYLEECRHELIKEVMRLKLENEWLTNTCRNNNLMSESNQLVLNSSPFNNVYNNNNNLMIRSINELKAENRSSFDKTIEFNLNGSDSDTKDEESWQQITVRLLHDLKRDMVNGQSGYTSDPQPAQGALPISDILSDYEDKQLSNKNKETIITINDSLSQTDETLMDGKNYSLIKREIQSKGLTPTESTALNGYSNSRYSLVLSEDRLKDEIFNNRSEKSSSEEKSEQKANANYFAIFDSNSIDNNIETNKAFSRAMSYLKRDLNEVFQALTTQNEKLNKLKAKQLRNYFKRQLNFDQNFHQTSTPLKIDPKFNHQNY